MTLIIETGAGVREANAYHDAAFVTSYLTQRNRQVENSWSTSVPALQNAAVIAATDFMENRFSHLLAGTKEFDFESVEAQATITFSGLPIAGQTFTLGDQTYTFVSTLTSVVNQILISSDASGTASNVSAAINATQGQGGVQYSTGTTLSRHASATSAAGVVSLTAKAKGASGGFTALQGTVANTAFTTFTGGLDGGSQSLSFPRVDLYDRKGESVCGVPLKWKQASAEYTIRAINASLAPDPTYDTRGGSVKRIREEVGPIREETEYVDGSYLSILIRPYPAADALVKEYLIGGGQGGVIR